MWEDGENTAPRGLPVVDTLHIVCSALLSMRCQRCKEDHDRVVDSRTSADGRAIRRRRECLACGLRYTTYERMESTPLRVIKKNGERVRFDRDRILTGMVIACEKLDVSLEELELAAGRIELACQEEFDREVPSTVIGNLVMEELRGLNQVAYVRFASVYREFKDADEFRRELEAMRGAAMERAPGTSTADAGGASEAAADTNE
jgi:transcriptional repressor NrdR